MDASTGDSYSDAAAGSCPGPEAHDEECDPGSCPVDGGWTPWQAWGECSVACTRGKEGEGYRRRHRACANPFPVGGGRKCEGDAEERQAGCPGLKPCPSEIED